MNKIIAVDFDGTLISEDYEGNITYINHELIRILKERKNLGDKLILWTCRGGEWLKQAVEFCKDHGLEFDAVNENVKGFTYSNVSCKVVADIYIDDKSIQPNEFIRKFK